MARNCTVEAASLGGLIPSIEGVAFSKMEALRRSRAGLLLKLAPYNLAAHEPFDLTLGPGERRFHRFPLQITHRHLRHETLRIYLPGNLGR